MEIFLFIAAHHYLSLFTQSFYHHRYSAHAMFTMSKFWERFFFILSIIFQGSSYLSPWAYGAMHRSHHSNADTEKDPHSPKYDGNIWNMMWKTKVIFTDIYDGVDETVDKKFYKNLPEWKTMDRIGSSWPCRIFFLALYVWFYVEFATELWQFMFLPLHFVMGPVHGAIINWFSHKIGYKNWKVKDTSTNMWPIDILMWGEALHNNHHKFGGSANFAKKWFEFDPMYPFIIAFNALGIIRLKKQDPEKFM